MAIEADDMTVLFEVQSSVARTAKAIRAPYSSQTCIDPHVSAAFVPTSPLESPYRFEGPKEEKQPEQKGKKKRKRNVTEKGISHYA